MTSERAAQWALLLYGLLTVGIATWQGAFVGQQEPLMPLILGAIGSLQLAVAARGLSGDS